jgi:elongation factor G
MILLWLGLKAKTRDDSERLGRGLEALSAADPTLAVDAAADGFVMLGAGSEEQLDVAIARLVHEFGIEADVSGIDIAYKEALTLAADGEAKYATQSGGRGQYAHVKIRVAPGGAGAGFVFDNALIGAAIPGEFVEPIAQSLRDACARGVVAGYPIDDVHLTLYDGSYHDVDSSADAFGIAAAQAFVDAAKNAQPVLLEPIMYVSLLVPEEFVARATAIFTARRGELPPGPRQPDAWMTVWGLMPLSETIGLHTEVRAGTAGRGICRVRFSHYAPVTLAGDEGDRDTPVREPKRPRTPPLVLRASVQEPRDSA